MALEGFSGEWVAPLFHMGEFNNLYFVVEKLFIMKFVINGFNNDRTFLLENVLIVVDGFIYIYIYPGKVMVNTFKEIHTEKNLKDDESHLTKEDRFLPCFESVKHW